MATHAGDVDMFTIVYPLPPKILWKRHIDMSLESLTARIPNVKWRIEAPTMSLLALQQFGESGHPSYRSNPRRPFLHDPDEPGARKGICSGHMGFMPCWNTMVVFTQQPDHPEKLASGDSPRSGVPSHWLGATSGAMKTALLMARNRG